MFSGGKINITEGRAALHTALRAPVGATILPPVRNQAAIDDPIRQLSRTVASRKNWRDAALSSQLT